MVFTAGNPIKWRLGNIEMPFVYKLTHLAIEECQKQSSYMGTINISISHDDNPAIAQFRDIKIFITDSRTEGGNQYFYLFAAQHFIKSSFFNIENLTFQG